MTHQRFDKDWDELAHKIGFPNKHDMLEDLYCVQGLSLYQIGERLGCSGHCVGRNLAREGILRRGKGGQNNDFTQTRKLFRLDQRVIMSREFTLTARAAYVSTTLLYRYRHLMKENNNGVLHPESSSGAGTVFNPE